MVRIARGRIDDLFALAEREAATGHPELANRYVEIARRVGMRYNVRLLPEYRELHCRGCAVFWVEGQTVRTRLRAGHRVRTCLRCGRIRRTRLRAGVPASGPELPERRPVGRAEAALVDLPAEDEPTDSDDGAEEE
jgi:ribonuclease P protein subunit RPR2